RPEAGGEIEELQENGFVDRAPGEERRQPREPEDGQGHPLPRPLDPPLRLRVEERRLPDERRDLRGPSLAGRLIQVFGHAPANRPPPAPRGGAGAADSRPTR